MSVNLHSEGGGERLAEIAGRMRTGDTVYRLVTGHCWDNNVNHEEGWPP